jgi:predicted SAM-dependent methyltransferase
MKLYIGSRHYKPDGYLTVDIDPNNHPDILSDAAALDAIPSGSVDEIMAGHVLEHIPYPRSFAALGEWARVLKVGGTLKVGVPDLKLLCSMIMRGVSVYQAIGLMYGTRRVSNQYEAHHWGYTREMLVEMFTVLGLGQFGSWNSPLHDASNGWMWGEADDRIAISLNLSGVKVREPLVDPKKAVEELMANIEAPFLTVVRKAALGDASALPEPQLEAELFQKLHQDLIEARFRIQDLENAFSARLARRIKQPMSRVIGKLSGFLR